MICIKFVFFYNQVAGVDAFFDMVWGVILVRNFVTVLQNCLNCYKPAFA